MAASGGRRATGKFRPHVATLKRLEGDETLLVQSGKPVGVFKTHADAPRVLIANSQSGAALGELGRIPCARPQGPDDVRPDDGGQLIYIGSQGIVQGTYETFAELGRRHYHGSLAGTLDPDGGPWRHGRRAAARRHDGGRLDCSPSNASLRASKCVCARTISTSRRSRRRGARNDHALGAREKTALCRTARQCGGRVCPSWCGAA